MPRLGEDYEIKLEVISKPKADYVTDEYFELDLPVAPAVMVGEEIVTEGKDISDEEIEKEICKQLGIDTPKSSKKTIVDRILKR